MSKIGRKPINIANYTVNIEGQIISYKGAKQSGTYVLPDCLIANIQDSQLTLSLKNSQDKKNGNIWGLHRALLANALKGSQEEFVKNIVIVGLGYKGELKGDTVIFSLGYSHKIDFKIPKNVSVAIDKTGQEITIRSCDKFLAGDVAQRICALRAPEPYKGTGVRLKEAVIHRKVGKS